MDRSVAFLVPMYQAEATIERCLQSMLQQTIQDFEVLVVDDASTDRSTELVHEAARADSRVRLIRNPTNTGVAHSLNIGLNSTSATYVARLDADDEATPDRLERQLELMQGSPWIGVSGSNVTYIGRTPAHDVLAPQKPLTDAEIRAEMASTMHSPFYHPSVIYKRAPVVESGGYREFFRNAEDYDLWLRLATKCAFANLEAPLTRYRVSPRGASLPRVREQRQYSILAKASAAQPETALEELWEGVAAAGDDPEMASFTARQYRHSAHLLADLGYPRQALGLLLGARTDIGYRPAARFVPGRLKRNLGRLRSKEDGAERRQGARSSGVE